MDEPWLVAAKKLPTGGKARFAHECGSGEAMFINNGPKGYSGYCNRCHATPFVPHGQRTFAELMELKRLDRELANQLSATVKLPHDFTLDIPIHGMLWLLKASITPHRARERGIGYSEYYDRVIMPVYKDGNLVYFQARKLRDHQDIKYINPKVDRSAIGYWVIPPGSTKRRIIIVEDFLSAIRVGYHTPAMSPMGTKLSIPLALQLSEYEHVTTWLDPDEAGVSGARDMRKLMALTTPTSNIATSLDPKDYSDEEIITYLSRR